jgi:hypothetical protein
VTQKELDVLKKQNGWRTASELLALDAPGVWQPLGRVEAEATLQGSPNLAFDVPQMRTKVAPKAEKPAWALPTLWP